VLGILSTLLIAFLLTLGNNVDAPSPMTAGSAPTLAYPKGASDPNYTILCVKKGDGKLRFTKTGPYATCPFAYETVPVQLKSKMIKK